MRRFTEKSLKDAGITIRSRVDSDKFTVIEWRVFDGRKLVSKHQSYDEALEAANALVLAEVS